MNYYDILEIGQNASAADIKNAAQNRVGMVKEAYQVLRDNSKRRSYDEDLESGSTMKDYYAVLGLPRKASGGQIEQAAKSLMDDLKNAYQTLSDADSRRAYNASLVPEAAAEAAAAAERELKAKAQAMEDEAGAGEHDPYSTPDSGFEYEEEEYAEFKLLSAQGRAGRIRYIAYSMVIGIVAQLIMGGAMMISPTIGILLAAVVGIAMLVVSIMLMIQRVHDFNRSGWLVLLILIPIANLIFWLVLWFVPGTQGSNNYGPPGTPNKKFEVLIAVIGIALFILSILAVLMMPAFFAGL